MRPRLLPAAALLAASLIGTAATAQPPIPPSPVDPAPKPAPVPPPAPPKPAPVPAPLTLVIPAEVRPVGGYARVNPKTNCVSVVYVALDPADPFPSEELKDAKRFLLPVHGLAAGRYRFAAVGAGKGGEQVRADFAVVVGDPPPGPGPVPPPKPVDPPAPAPTAFRVMLVYESGQTHTADQTAVLYGKQVEDYLTAKCTGGKAGWCRRDKDTDPAADTTPFKDAWAAVKPRVSAVPCLAIDLGGNHYAVEQPLPATPADLIRVLDKYREGK